MGIHVCVHECVCVCVCVLGGSHSEMQLSGSHHHTHHLLEEIEGVALLNIDEDLQWAFGGLLELYLYVKPERGIGIWFSISGRV